MTTAFFKAGFITFFVVFIGYTLLVLCGLGWTFAFFNAKVEGYE